MTKSEETEKNLSNSIHIKNTRFGQVTQEPILQGTKFGSGILHTIIIERIKLVELQITMILKDNKGMVTTVGILDKEELGQLIKSLQAAHNAIK